MPELPLKVKFLGAEAEKGMAKLQQSAGSTASIFAKLSGALAAGAIVNSLKNMYMGFEKDEQAARQLDRSIARLNGSRATQARATEIVRDATLRLGQDEDVTSAALSRLVTKTGNAKLAIDNFGTAQDLAAKLGMDLNSAVDMTAKVITGQFLTVGRALPFMKAWAAQHKELVGTLEGATEATKILRDAVSGEAGAMAGGSLGQINRLRGIWKEMGDEVGRMMTGSTDTATAWKSIADDAQRFLLSMEKVKGLPVIQTITGALRLSWGEGAAWDQFDQEVKNAATRNGRGWGGGLPGFAGAQPGPGTVSWTQSIYGPTTNPDVPYAESDWAGPPARTRKKKKRKKGTSPAPWTGADWAGPEQPQAWSAGDSLDLNYDEGTAPRMSLPDTGRFMDAEQQRANAAKTALNKRLADEKKFTLDATSFAENMFAGTFSNIQNGWQAMVSSMEQSFVSMLVNIASKKAAAWLVSTAFPAAAAASGAAAGGAAAEAAANDAYWGPVNKSMPYGAPGADAANLMRRRGRW
jgi:hypothetical protein